MLTENGDQESIISKVFKRTTNNHSLSQSQAADIQEEGIRMSISFSLVPSIEDTSEKLRHILISRKVRSIFYTESTLRKLLFKLKDRVAREDKNNIVYEI